MIVFSIASIVFLLVVVVVLNAQRHNEQRVSEVAEKFSRTINNVVPLVQKQHTLQFGHASAALEEVSSPKIAIPPKMKSRSA